MKQAIKALSFATKILWTIVLIFSITAAYSAMNLRVGFGKPETSVSDTTVTLSTPLFINNTGFYEIADINITTHIKDHDNKDISTSTTIVPVLSPSDNIQKTHNMTLNISNLTKEFTYLAFNDSIFNVYTLVTLRFARVIPVQISLNATMPWGAPFYNFSIGDISLNYIEKKIIAPLSFENHAFFSISGNMRLEVYNENSEQISTTEVLIEVPAGSGFRDSLEMEIDPSELTPEGQIHIFFETSMFNVGPIMKSWVIPHG
jgi:hypothetical protein